MYGYEWTDEYGIFRLTIDAKLQKEIRPVFWEELEYFNFSEHWDYPKTDMPLLWAEGIRKYILNGECVAEAVGGSFYTRPKIVFHTEKRLRLKAIDVKRLYAVNARLMKGLEHKSISFIRKQYEKYSSEKYHFICAFSGGKDSIVLLDLCAKALAPEEFSVVFSNTGMELSDTYKAVERAQKHWPELNFYEAQCHMKPTETWDEFGPPGRRMRWCCVVHKSVPTLLKLRELTGNYNAKAVVFDGVRAEESAKRSKYDEISEGAKNISQVNCSPILKWNTAELYCYILFNDILMNDAYRRGLFRVGCMVCPMSSDWWDGIANDCYHEEMQPLLSKVEEYAQKAKPENETRKYIEDGGWKARMGGRGLEKGGNRVSEEIRNNSISFKIPRTLQQWTDISKVLGYVSENENGAGVQRINNIQYSFQIAETESTLTVTYRPFSKMDRFTVSHLRSVAEKVAYCIGCKACMVQCPTGAFSIQEGKIFIRESLCVHCCNCLTFTEKGCLVAKSLSTTGGTNMNMKGMNPYQHFGFRQTWFDHFCDLKTDCFSAGVLGNRQYDALKVWLKEARILSLHGKTLEITDLGKKLIERDDDNNKPFGPFKPLTWAIIWANLAYNSIIARWYCLNAEIGETYEKNDLVAMIGEEYTKSTRDNAITALLETFRFSPIGSSIEQGVPMAKTATTYSYLRNGWSMPDGVALLYSLYLYAEHTGRHSFTLTELIKVHNTPDAPGVSPADIFGFDSKHLREYIQGLALTYPEYIRVSFINDLDNIVLDGKHTSLSVLDLAEENKGGN